MGGSKGGSADESGVYEAMASAQAADQAYALGEQQLQWSQQVWNQEQPLVNQSEQVSIQLGQADIASLQQMQAFSQEQEDLWNQYYAPLDEAYVQQAENWASPGNIALVTGQAQANVAEQAQAGLGTAAEQLESYGINPGAGRYAGLLIGANVNAGAAQAAAGTTAAQNLKLQQLALEQGAINTGQGVANTVGQLTNAATGASQAGTSAAGTTASTAQSNLSTGTAAQTAATNWYNTGANNMSVYTNAVNSYNNTQLGYAQIGASEMLGLGSFAGGVLGDITGSKGLLGDLGFSSDKRDKTDIKKLGLDRTGIPMYAYRYKGDPKSYPKVVGPMAQDIEKLGGRVGQVGKHKVLGFQEGGQVPQQAIPVPSGGTPGGFVPHHASPSGGQVEDDVDAKLTAGEFVMPKDVSQWMGQKAMVTQIDKARQEMQMFGNRNDIGGEPAPGQPSPNPQFVSRPGMQQSVGPPPQGQQQGMPQQGIPASPMLAMGAQPPGPRMSPTGVNQQTGIPLPA
jgi:hypothetical protein